MADIKPITEESFIQFQTDYANMCGALQAFVADKVNKGELDTLNCLYYFVLGLLVQSITEKYKGTDFEPSEFN